MVRQRLFTKNQIKKIRRLREGGATYRSIADTYGVSVPAIRQICLGETYRDV